MGPGTETRAPAREPRQSSETRAWPEVLAIWTLLAAVALEIVVTYSRIPAHELYHVHRHGFTNGLSRAATFLNFPAGALAIATLPSSYERRPGLWTAAVAAAALVLCCFTFAPGVVRQSNLDARPINAVAATGLLLAVLLSLGRPGPWRRLPGDRLRLVFVAPLVLLALPWIGADLGFSYGGLPGLGQGFQTNELRAQPHVLALHPAVHLGHHHGLDGLLMTISGLLVLRLPMHRRALGIASRAYAAFLVAWGIGNIVNDAWLEQVVKRGWTRDEVPGVLSLHWNWTWAAVIVGAAAVFSFRPRPPREPRRVRFFGFSSPAGASASSATGSSAGGSSATGSSAGAS